MYIRIEYWDTNRRLNVSVMCDKRSSGKKKCTSKTPKQMQPSALTVYQKYPDGRSAICYDKARSRKRGRSSCLCHSSFHFRALLVVFCGLPSAERSSVKHERVDADINETKTDSWQSSWMSPILSTDRVGRPLRAVCRNHHIPKTDTNWPKQHMTSYVEMCG
jgi:hypothetical protein